MKRPSITCVALLALTSLGVLKFLAADDATEESGLDVASLN
jgi:hypothetical protein